MTLIEGIGDEVTHFFVVLFAILIITFAWWTTNISEQRHVRTVLLLERRRHRAHRRLTNHTEAVTITESTTQNTPITELSPLSDTSTELAHASNSTEIDATESESREAQNIIETMDSDACVLRQRRLAFYGSWNSDNQSSSDSQIIDQSEDIPNRIEEIEGTSSDLVMEHNYAEHPVNTTDNAEASDKSGTKSDSNKLGITIKLKYLNDDLLSVDGRLNEMLGDFKKRHFQSELSDNKIIRLIFNGQVLQPDSQTLGDCGLFDNCVVHCLIHQNRAATNETAVEESRRDGYSFPTPNGIPNFNNNNQNREWDLGNFLFAFISFILLAAWYFRYVYAHLYTVTATVGLILITGIFTIVLVGMYFPDNENLPNPTIRIARERVSPQQ